MPAACRVGATPAGAAAALLLLAACVCDAAPGATGCRELGFTETLVCSKCDRWARAPAGSRRAPSSFTGAKGRRGCGSPFA